MRPLFSIPLALLLFLTGIGCQPPTPPADPTGKREGEETMTQTNENEYPFTPEEQQEIDEFLAKYGNDVHALDEEGVLLLHQAIRLGEDIAVIKFLVSEGADIQAKTKDGFTPLHIAANTKDIALVQFLVSQGADVNAKDDHGKTPLFWAAVLGNWETAQFLISEGADINTKTEDGYTLLHWMVSGGRKLQMATLEEIQYIVSQGANVNAKNNHGKTPLDIAQEGEKTEVVEFLQSVGGKSGAEDGPAAGADWIPLFDGESLENWSVPVYGGDGKVEVKEGNIVIGKGDAVTGILYEKEFPKVHYEIQYEARRTGGYDFFGSCTFPIKESFCTFVTGGWGGGLTGLSNIDGYNAYENTTGQHVDYEDHVWYRFRIQVTDERLRVWLTAQDEEGKWEAEKCIIEMELEDREFSIRYEMEQYKPLGFCTYVTEGQIRNIEYRKRGK